MAAVPSRPATICPVTQHSCRGSVRSTAKYGAMESAGSSPNSRIRMSVVYELDSAMSARSEERRVGKECGWRGATEEVENRVNVTIYLRDKDKATCTHD